MTRIRVGEGILGTSFIDGTVAVVVDLVATDFVDGCDFAFTSPPDILLASAFAETTGPHVLCTGGAAVTRLLITILAGGGGTIFVNTTVAIVVFLVATDLWGTGVDIFVGIVTIKCACTSRS